MRDIAKRVRGKDGRLRPHLSFPRFSHKRVYWCNVRTLQSLKATEPAIADPRLTATKTPRRKAWNLILWAMSDLNSKNDIRITEPRRETLAASVDENVEPF